MIAQHVLGLGRPNYSPPKRRRDDDRSDRRRLGLTEEVQCDAINAYSVSAGRFAYFGVVPRTQILGFRSSQRFLRLVRFPAAPLRKCCSED
jgi:hypothetical protein